MNQTTKYSSSYFILLCFQVISPVLHQHQDKQRLGKLPILKFFFPETLACSGHGWWLREGRCYFPKEAEKTWEWSKTKCEQRGGYLAVPDTDEENDVIKDM